MSTLYQGGISHCLELGGPSEVALGCSPTKRHVIHRAWGGALTLGPRECSGTGEEEAAGTDGCSIGQAPCDQVNGWNMGACPINM